MGLCRILRGIIASRASSKTRQLEEWVCMILLDGFGIHSGCLLHHFKDSIVYLTTSPSCR